MIDLILGDITKIKADAIVNAANETLLGGGGVDGAIHKAAGPLLLQECKTLGGAYPGDAKITHGYNLPAKWVIHTVGPRYKGKKEDEEILKRCYENSLCIARSYHLYSIAFPSISTGAFGYPIEKAAPIAINTVKEFLEKRDYLGMRVIFVLHSKRDFEVYKKLLG
jgi:O-acetyl-ADP-ribose deacetylase (regulator of RNase III)